MCKCYALWSFTSLSCGISSFSVFAYCILLYRNGYGLTLHHLFPTKSNLKKSYLKTFFRYCFKIANLFGHEACVVKICKYLSCSPALAVREKT